MLTLKVLLVLSAVVLGALARRAWGEGFWKIRKALRILAMSALGALVTLGATGDWRAMLVGAVLGAAIWPMGQGSYIDMGTAPGNPPDNEELAPAFDALLKDAKLGPTGNDLVRMALLYSLFTLPASFALVVLGHWGGVYLGPTGMLVAVAYWAARRAYPKVLKSEPAVIAEYFAGALVYGGLALA